MPTEPKPTIADAVDKATKELETSSTEVETPAPAQTPEATPTGDQPAKETPVEEPVVEKPSLEDASSSSKEGSVDEVVDAAIQSALSKMGGATEPGQKKSARDQLVDLLIGEIKSDILKTKKTEEGPMDISQVDGNDKTSVQKYVDSRIKHAVMGALQPLQREMSIRQADQELRKLASDHPDAYKHGKAIAKVIEDFPTLPLEYAYRIVASNARVEEGTKKAYDSMAKKKSANLTTSTAKSPAETPKAAKSAREAVLMAMDETGATFGEA